MMLDMPKGVRVSVPGKVLLAGEYTVLLGSKSLSLAIDKRLEAVLSPRNKK